jgi:UDP-3-O-[3-hydroxymyristoyl] glucosamine N-acyltransferase
MIVQLPIKTLLSVLDNVISCDADNDFVVHRMTSLTSAESNDLAVVLDRGDASVFGAVSSDAIKNSKAGVLLTQEPFAFGHRYIVVKDALTAFTKLTTFIMQQQVQKLAAPVIEDNVSVDPSAVIRRGSVIGAGSVVSAHVFIGIGCNIGKNALLYPGVKILDYCIIGDNVIIHAGAVIGSDGFGYQVSKTGLRKLPHVGIVRIGSNVEIGANCTIDRAMFDQTSIGDGVKLDNSVHIAHNVTVGAHTVILAQTGIAGSVEIGVGCQIGGQVAIKDHVKIGNGVKIVSTSAVMNDVKNGEIVAGVPAIQFGQWKRQMVALNKLPDIVKQANKLKESATKSWWQRLFG